MKSELKLSVALMPGNGLKNAMSSPISTCAMLIALLSTTSAQVVAQIFNPSAAPPSPELRIVIKPSKASVHTNEEFAVALRIENPTSTNQTVRMMSCSWDMEWQSSNPKISSYGWACLKNFPIDVEIPPGAAYTNNLEMFVTGPIADKTLAFRMGFTSIGSKKTFWSGEAPVEVILTVTTDEMSRPGPRGTLWGMELPKR